jgi:Glycosyl transferase family 2
MPENSGKGAAVLEGLRTAKAEGFTDALIMDAGGQHPAELIRTFMEAAAATPDAIILGHPVFGPDAPLLRIGGGESQTGGRNLRH